MNIVPLIVGSVVLLLLASPIANKLIELVFCFVIAAVFITGAMMFVQAIGYGVMKMLGFA